MCFLLAGERIHGRLDIAVNSGTLLAGNGGCRHWQNGYAERVIGSIRRDCLDHVAIFGERHLRRLFQSYQGYCNELRTHLSRTKMRPCHERCGRQTACCPCRFWVSQHSLLRSALSATPRLVTVLCLRRVLMLTCTVL